MRFRRLSLDAYGPFSGLSLDLSRAEGNGLHLIYGPNEAGKSSALRGIRDLLFGIPQLSKDAHLHPTSSLRLSAVIERDGDELGFVRRKKRKDSLSTLDDKPLEEAQLARFLNGLDAGSFDRLFGLDHERLRQGGEEMLSGKGDVGEALFDAGASGRSVHRVRLALVEEADALFKDRAQKPELNRLLALYTEQKRRAKDAVHSPEKYEEQQERVRETRRDAEARRAELARLRAEKEHLGRLRNVLSSVVERDRKFEQRAALGQVPPLRADIGRAREQLVSSLAEAERDVTRLSRQQHEQREKLERLPEPSPLLGMPKDRALALKERIGGAESSIADLPKRRAEARALRDAIQAELPRLGLGDGVDAVAARALPVSEQARVQELGREAQALGLTLQNAQRELPEARSKLAALLEIVSQAKAARRIERARLLPSEICERHDGALKQAREACAALSERVAEIELEVAARRQQLELLRGKKGVPSDALLAEARAARDARLREAQELAADPKRKALELSLPLAALAYTSTQADTLVDRLRSEAQRVAEIEALEQSLAKLADERERLLIGQERAGAALAEVTAAWQQLSATLFELELTPREAAHLLQDERDAWRDIERNEQELLRAKAALAAAEQRVDSAEAGVAKWRAEWQAAVAPLGLPADARPRQVLSVLDALSELARQLRELAERETRAAKIQRDIDDFEKLATSAIRAFAPELAGLSAVEAAKRLFELHQAASSAALERASVEAELGRSSRELRDAEGRRDAQQRALSELCASAGVTDPAALLELEQKVERATGLEAELLQLDARLAEVCEGEDVASLVEEARSSERGAIAAKLAELDDLIPLREEEARDSERELTRLDLGLQVYGGRDGADAAQELSATVARMAELSSAWARRRLAAVVLERVVEGYRERHQGPVLSRASELFQRLTLGRFSRLQVGLEDTLLECVQAADGKGLEIEDLSRGTRFQLYLALKLASLEQYLNAAPPLPLVLDDVLVEWDDERSRVALTVLAELSERVQVLLFTHLARDVAAAEGLHDGRIFTHHLEPRGAQPEPRAFA